MKANNDVTEALRRTIDLMQGELERSVLSTQMLGSYHQSSTIHPKPNLPITDTSTATLRSTSNTYDTLDNILTASKQLVTALEKADRMDKLLIMAGLVFFFLVVLFILKQRVLDRGIRIALFWTRFIPRKAKTIEDILERGDLKVISTATSVATSVTTLAVSVLRYGRSRRNSNQTLTLSGSSASIASLVESGSPSSLPGTERSAELIETVTSIIIDEPPVPPAHRVSRDEL